MGRHCPPFRLLFPPGKSHLPFFPMPPACLWLRLHAALLAEQASSLTGPHLQASNKVKRPPKIQGNEGLLKKTEHQRAQAETKTKEPQRPAEAYKNCTPFPIQVGPRWNRRFKFQSPGSRHLHRHKSQANLIRKRRTRYVHVADMRKVKKLVPYFKRKSLKQRY